MLHAFSDFSGAGSVACDRAFRISHKNLAVLTAVYVYSDIGFGYQHESNVANVTLCGFPPLCDVRTSCDESHICIHIVSLKPLFASLIS